MRAWLFGGIVLAIVGIGGIAASLEWVGGLLLAGGLGEIGARSSPAFAGFLVVANLLDVVAYCGLMWVSLGVMGRREWALRPAYYLGWYFLAMMSLQAVSRHFFRIGPLVGILEGTGRSTPTTAAIISDLFGLVVILAVAGALTDPGV